MHKETVINQPVSEPGDSQKESSDQSAAVPYPDKVKGRFIVILFSFGILLVAGFLIFRISEKKRVIDSRSDFTSLEITLSGNKTYTISGATRKGPFILMFFDAECYYCHVETEAIIENIDRFAGVTVFMVTANDQETFSSLADKYRLADYPGITSGRVTEEVINNKFGIFAFPSLLMYDKSGNLIFSSFGYTTIEEIMEALGR